MAAEHAEFVPHRSDIAADIAEIAEPGDRTQRKLFATTGDHYRRVRLLHGLWFEDRVLDAEIAAVERGARLRPQAQDQAHCLLHLADADGGAFREFPAILPVLGL